jgi:mannose-6-phosphate isomerase-like protein (cupin superfamily)
MNYTAELAAIGGMKMKQALNGLYWCALAVSMIVLVGCQTSSSLHAAKEGNVISAPTIADPVAVSPKNYRVLAENDRARVIKGTLGPGERDQWHGHPESAVYPLRSGKGRVYFPDGTAKDIVLKEGNAFLQPLVSSHSLQNTGDTVLEFLMFEMK